VATIHSDGKEELKTTDSWQLRKAIFFDGSEHIVISFDDYEQIFSPHYAYDVWTQMLD
jgi:hypothetical protein